jgi:hypothetical protein
MGAAAEQYQGKKAWAYTSFASVLGAAALVTAVIAVITAVIALAILVGTTLVLRLVATGSPGANRGRSTPPAEVQGRDRR